MQLSGHLLENHFSGNRVNQDLTESAVNNRITLCLFVGAVEKVLTCNRDVLSPILMLDSTPVVGEGRRPSARNTDEVRQSLTHAQETLFQLRRVPPLRFRDRDS